MDNSNSTQEFIVTARKWRPLRFRDVVGQEHITMTLKNAIRLNRIHHALLFSGPRGVGKTTTARIFARAINCLAPKDGEPCNECESCTSVTAGRSIDVIEIDGASNNSVDDIRKLRENAKYPPSAGRYKMYIIDEVHMLSTSAFNALLKTLEEPPAHLLFVFATTEPHKVPATILSRCQRFEFRRMEIPDIVGQLKHIAENEGIKVDEEALISIAKKADGSMRDSQSIFDQVVAFCGREITYADMADALHLIDRDFFFRISAAVKAGDIQEMFMITNRVLNKGYDLQECLNGLLEHFRNILAYKTTGDEKLLESSASYLEKYKQDAEYFSKADLLRIMNLIATTEQTLKFSPQPRVRFELALVQMASMDNSLEIKELLEEIRELKKVQAGNGTFTPLPAQKNPAMIPMETKPEYNVPQPRQMKVKLEHVPFAAPFTSKVLNEQMPAMNFASDMISPVVETSVKTAGDVSSDALRRGWSSFLDEYATGETGFHILGQSAIITPKFYNGEIIFQAANQFVADNISKRKQALLHNLSQFFGNKVSVKIAVGLPDEPGEIIGKEIANQKETSSKPADSYSAVPEPAIMTGLAAREQVRESGFEGKHPVEIAIINLFDAKEYGNPDTV